MSIFNYENKGNIYNVIKKLNSIPQVLIGK